MATSFQSKMVDLLRASSLLEALPESELEALAERAHRTRYDTGDVIFRKGDDGSGMMVLVTGRVKIGSVSHAGGEVILNVMEPGQVFGEMALVDGEPRSADAIAAKPTELVTVLRRDFLPILKRQPDAALQMMTILSHRIRHVTQFVEDAIFLDVPARLLSRIEYLADKYGTADPETGATRIEHEFTQQDLADSVGVTRVSINRQLSLWEERGLIKKGRGWLAVPDLERLDAFVRG